MAAKKPINMIRTATRKRIHVAVGVIRGADGRILVARRAEGQHLGGLWEFPGGKVEDGESVDAALHRELLEELGIRVRTQTPLMQIRHDYPDKLVLLDVRTVTNFSEAPVAREGQPLRWLMPCQLRPEEFPEANRAIIRSLQLPDYLAIYASDSAAASSAMMAALPPDTLLRLRRTFSSENATAAYPDLVVAILDSSRRTGVGLIVDLDHQETPDPALAELIRAGEMGLRGCHATSRMLTTLHARPVPDHLLFGVSCHSAVELNKARQVGADYALLSPVLPSSSHPGSPVLGWQGLAQLLKNCDLPVYALGGMQLCDLKTAQAAGARGIAGISAFQAN